MIPILIMQIWSNIDYFSRKNRLVQGLKSQMTNKPKLRSLNGAPTEQDQETNKNSGIERSKIQLLHSVHANNILGVQTSHLKE